MSEKMRLTSKAEIVASIVAMLDDPSVELTIKSGTVHWPNYATQHMESAPTPGRTVTIEVHGGARHVDVESREDAEPYIAGDPPPTLPARQPLPGEDVCGNAFGMGGQTFRCGLVKRHEGLCLSVEKRP